MKWFTHTPGNLASFVPRYPVMTRQSILRWHEFAVQHAFDVQPDNFREFVPWLLVAYRDRSLSKARSLPRHSFERRNIARNLLTLRLYRKEVARLLT